MKHLQSVCALAGATLLTAASAQAAEHDQATLETGWCIPAADGGNLLETNDAYLLWWTNGRLVLRDQNDDWQWRTTKYGANAELCFESSGELVVYDNGAVDWSSGTAGQGVTDMAVDACGLKLRDADGLPVFQRGLTDACDADSVPRGWCRDADEPATLIETNAFSLRWESNGNLVLYRADGSVGWETGTAGYGERLCFNNNGLLKVNKKFSAWGHTTWQAIWQAGTGDGSADVLVVRDGTGAVALESSAGVVDWSVTDAVGATGVVDEVEPLAGEGLVDVIVQDLDVVPLETETLEFPTVEPQGDGTLLITGVNSVPVEVVRSGDVLQVLMGAGVEVWTTHNYVDGHWDIFSMPTGIVFVGSDDDDTFTNNSDLPLVADGGLGADTIAGGSADDVIVAGFGEGDVLAGGAGNDELDAADAFGPVTLSGGAGTDVLLCATKFDTIDPGDHCATEAEQAGDSFVISEADGFGNKNFGAGYSLVVAAFNRAGLASSISQQAMGNPTLLAQVKDLIHAVDDLPDDFAHALGNAAIEATLFGEDITVAEFNGYATSGDGENDNLVTLEVLGFTVDEYTANQPIEYYFTQEFFAVSTTFTLVMVPVTVSGSLSGHVGASGGMSIGATGVSADFTPGAGLTAAASAGVGVACASAGIQGEINLFSVDVPNVLSLNFGGPKPTYTVSSAIDFSALDGSVSLYVEACIAEASKTLAEWDGIGDTITLFQDSGTL
ncbi:MAG: hypothetical protein H6733_17940 [Alphaproteobacteria bacterium]|nr:hypothetical protein [Myxococcales bacterium]MCB9683351.1 hypothetical protein [Alphaproteobacteria bacterium]